MASEQQQPTVGFVGLGAMGSRMAAGFPMICFDVAGIEARSPEGAKIAASVGAVGGGGGYHHPQPAQRRDLGRLPREWAGALDRMRHEIHVMTRELEGREASPAAGAIDGQSVKSAEIGGRDQPDEP